MKPATKSIFALPLVCAMFLQGCGAGDPNQDPASPPYPNTDYTAAYESVQGDKQEKHFDWGTVNSDGKGRLLISHGAFIRLEDYIKKTVTQQNAFYLPNVEILSIFASNAILEGVLMNENLAVWHDKVHRQKYSSTDNWWAIITQDRFFPIGEKRVEGYKCRGWKSTANYYPVGFTWTEYWYDVDTGCLVRQDNFFMGKASSLRLKTLTSLAVPIEAFDLPITDKELWKDVTGRIAVSPEERRLANRKDLSPRHNPANRKSAEKAQPANHLHMRPFNEPSSENSPSVPISE